MGEKLSKKILIVEDEKPISKALELKLSISGYNVRCAFDGIEAIELLKKEKFDLILLDLMMPKKDGFTVLQEMKDKGIKVPVIVSSNLSQSEDFSKAKQLGAVDFFVKSNTPIVEVVNNIKKIVGD